MLTSGRMLLPVLLVLCGCATSDESTSTYSITLDEGREAFVTSPETCNADIGSGGGDLIEAGVRYRGKCEGAGVAPKVKIRDGVRHLTFSADASYHGETKTRSELALTRTWFAFREPVYVGFRISIPEGVDRTRGFFYMLQFWQCAGTSPIAGIRMSRGYSHRVNFMTRGDSRSGSMARYDLVPDTWTSFVIKAIVDPDGEMGSFAVWHDPEGEPDVYEGPYGYAKSGVCRGREGAPPQRFRIKFGLYKDNERGKVYEVEYDDIRIGSSFDAVSPWASSS